MHERAAMNTVIKIGERAVGQGQPAFVIAEAGANHNGDFTLAKEMVAAASELGCDCIKFQTFTAELFCADRTKTFTYKSQGNEVTESEFEMFKRFEFSPDQWAELMAYCKVKGIFFLTTVQDPDNLKMMLKLGLQGIKVGSDDFDHLVNLELYAKTGLPLIVSKGMADLGETDRVIRTLQTLTDKLMVLQCVSLYPTDPKLLNIRQLPTLIKLYPDVIWGFSDHSQGTLASSLAVALGAKVIEKHFTMSHDLPGPDHWFSMDVNEMAQLVKDIRFAELALGSSEIITQPDELHSKSIMRRRIVAKSNLEPNTVLNEDTVAFKRADQGAFVGQWDLIKGHRLSGPKPENQGIDFVDVDFSNRD
jgi:N,N'-diacetyllegionaminate synthase